MVLIKSYVMSLPSCLEHRLLKGSHIWCQEDPGANLKGLPLAKSGYLDVQLSVVHSMLKAIGKWKYNNEWMNWTKFGNSSYQSNCELKIKPWALPEVKLVHLARYVPGHNLSQSTRVKEREPVIILEEVPTNLAEWVKGGVEGHAGIFLKRQH